MKRQSDVNVKVADTRGGGEKKKKSTSALNSHRGEMTHAEVLNKVITLQPEAINNVSDGQGIASKVLRVYGMRYSLIIHRGLNQVRNDNQKTFNEVIKVPHLGRQKKRRKI